MKHVYILTEHGKTYTDEGLKFVAEGIKNHFGYDDEIIFVSGEAYNEAKHLKRELEYHVGSYVVISHEKGIFYLADTNVKGLERALGDYPDETSWNTAVRFFIDDIDYEDNRTSNAEQMDDDHQFGVGHLFSFVCSLKGAERCH